MVSNSVVMGALKVTTRPRDWTAEEIDRYGKPPPAYLAPNLHPTLGEDVPSLNGWPWKNRYVEPEGRLLGLEYHIGEWDKKKRIGSLVPIFSQDQPPSSYRARTRPSGLRCCRPRVNFDHKDGTVFGIRLLFRRLKSDAEASMPPTPMPASGSAPLPLARPRCSATTAAASWA